MNRNDGINSITRPTLLLNELQARENIRRMAEKAATSGVDFRPHFKTHQSIEIGQWFRDQGTKKITVSSIDMAAYFSSDGWEDITIAFPLNIRQMTDVKELAFRTTLGILVENAEAIQALGGLAPSRIKLWIKIDCGLHRSGINWQATDEVESLLREARKFSNLEISGILTHAGNTYSAHNPQEAVDIHLESNRRMQLLREALNISGLKISVGDTPGCSLSSNFSGVDEIRPGNFVFFDAEQLEIGSCSADQIAVVLACPIVATHKDRNEVVVYGGAIHISKETFLHNGKPVFGLCANPVSPGWRQIMEGCSMTRTSQEHGILSIPAALKDEFSVGDIAYVIPAHSCLTAHLMRRYKTMDGRIIEMMPV